MEIERFKSNVKNVTEVSLRQTRDNVLKLGSVEHLKIVEAELDELLKILDP